LVFILGINSPLAVFVIMYANGGYANYASISLAGCAWQVASKTEGSSTLITAIMVTVHHLGY
jgi:hypothetical protein